MSPETRTLQQTGQSVLQMYCFTVTALLNQYYMTHNHLYLKVLTVMSVIVSHDD